jgi:hypothetical protein
MKELINKTQQKIYAIWRKAKQHISSFVGGQFKDDKPLINENDWYYNTKWFSKYFFDKLKRKAMNIIYKLYSSIEEYLLEKYLVEFYFYTGVLDKDKLDEYNKKHGTMYLGEFKCYLPILFMVKNYEELEYLVTIMNDEFYREYKCKPILTNISERILTEEMLSHKIELSKSKLKNGKTGTLNIETFTPQPTDKELKIKYNVKKDRYKFQILKSGPLLLRNKIEYIVQFCKTTTEE